jgi:hypothetical protein
VEKKIFCHNAKLNNAVHKQSLKEAGRRSHITVLADHKTKIHYFMEYLRRCDNSIWILSCKIGVNFINVTRKNILYERRFSSYVLALLKNLYEKRAHIMLMKLTIGISTKDLTLLFEQYNIVMLSKMYI